MNLFNRKVNISHNGIYMPGEMEITILATIEKALIDQDMRKPGII